MKHLLIYSAILLTPFQSSGTNSIPTYKTDTPPIIDGELSEQLWESCTPITDFFTFKPIIGQPAEESTLVYTAYDSENLYFAFRCFDRTPELIKATLARRDGILEEDYVGVVIDAQEDKQFVPFLCANAKGVQVDALIDAGRETDVSQDFLYESAGAFFDGGYTVEIRVPLKSLRYREGDVTRMGIGFGRKIVHNSQYYHSPGYYPDRGPFAAQLGTASFAGLAQRNTLEILPSVIYSRHRSLNNSVYKTDIDKAELGVTAKYGIGSSIILDATYNPDFSQIEADAGRVDVNLRFPQYYPEKRPFFMEGLEIFNFAGLTQTSAIGAIVSTRNIIQPRFGVKVTGKTTARGQLAALIASDQSTRDLYPSINEDAYFGIFRYKQYLTGDNFIGGMIAGRDFSSTYNHVGGVDVSHRISGTTVIRGNYVQSYNNPNGGDVSNGHNFDLNLNYRDNSNSVTFGVNDMSKDFHLDMGFVPRDGISAVGLNANRIIPLENDFFNSITPGTWAFYQHDKYWNKDEGLCQLSLNFGLPNTSYLHLSSAFYSETFFVTAPDGVTVLGDVYDLSFSRVELGLRPINSIYINTGYQFGGKPYYSPIAPYQGDVRTLDYGVTVQANERMTNEVSGVYSEFSRRSDGDQIYKFKIVRLKSTYQLNRYIQFRGVVENNNYSKIVLTDLLAGFTYIPGTVIYAGYGSLVENTIDRLADFKESDQSLFFKASYNWRM